MPTTVPGTAAAVAWVAAALTKTGGGSVQQAASWSFGGGVCSDSDVFHVALLVGRAQAREP